MLARLAGEDRASRGSERSEGGDCSEDGYQTAHHTQDALTATVELAPAVQVQLGEMAGPLRAERSIAERVMRLVREAAATSAEESDRNFNYIGVRSFILTGAPETL